MCIDAHMQLLTHTYTYMDACIQFFLFEGVFIGQFSGKHAGKE